MDRCLRYRCQQTHAVRRNIEPLQITSLAKYETGWPDLRCFGSLVDSNTESPAVLVLGPTRSGARAN